MILSKPLLDFTASYLHNLYVHPIKTKSLTSGILASIANFSSQSIKGESPVNYENVAVFGLFGLLFGGAIPHYFFTFLEKFGRKKYCCSLFWQLLMERVLYMPVFQFFQLYMISVLEGKSHLASLNHSLGLLNRVVNTNWKWITILQIINLKFVPPMFRVLFGNLVGFVWIMYVASTRRDLSKREDKIKKFAALRKLKEERKREEERRREEENKSPEE